MPYKFTDTDKKDSKSTIKTDGRIRRDSLNEGSCSVQLFNVSNAKWSKDKAKVDEKLKLSADVEGFNDGTEGTFEIYCKDIRKADSVVETLNAKTKGNKIEAEWKYEIVDSDENDDSDGNEQDDDQGYSFPQFYFKVIVDSITSTSGLLNLNDWIEIELKDEKGNPIKNEDYILNLPNGEIKKGKLDPNGYKKIENIPLGKCSIKFPNLSEYESD